MHDSLGVVVDLQSDSIMVLPGRASWKQDLRQANKACSLFCAYRLVDVCALLEGLYPSLPSHLPVGIRGPIRTPLSSMEVGNRPLLFHSH